jgi:hypothetical protein
MNWTVLKRQTQMSGKHMKKIHLPFHREMQIKPTLRLHLILVRMAAIEKTMDGKDAGENEPLYTAGRNVN